MIETSRNNAALVTLFTSAAPHPYGGTYPIALVWPLTLLAAAPLLALVALWPGGSACRACPRLLAGIGAVPGRCRPPPGLRRGCGGCWSGTTATRCWWQRSYSF